MIARCVLSTFLHDACVFARFSLHNGNVFCFPMLCVCTGHWVLTFHDFTISRYIESMFLLFARYVFLISRTIFDSLHFWFRHVLFFYVDVHLGDVFMYNAFSIFVFCFQVGDWFVCIVRTCSSLVANDLLVLKLSFGF